MNTVALFSLAERQNLFTETGVRTGLPPFHVEKDFWVCWVLSVLFGHSEVGPNLTFRGGTSLSKAWGIIERFSEDIDLAMSRDWLGLAKNPGEPGISASEKERRLKALRDECREVIANKLVPVLTDAAQVLNAPYRLEVEPLDKARDPFCVYFTYPSSGLRPSADYNQATVKIELSGRAADWPMEEKDIRPYVAERFPQQTGNPKISLSCVRPERTFWEKAALIHEQNARTEEKALAPRQARHLSDLVRLWATDEVKNAENFLPLFDGVKAHRRSYFDYAWVNYEQLTPGRLQLVPPSARLPEWRADYQAMRAMFFSEPLGFDELVQQLRSIEDSLADR
jgi:hypothetical protein